MISYSLTCKTELTSTLENIVPQFQHCVKSFTVDLILTVSSFQVMGKIANDFLK